MIYNSYLPVFIRTTIALLILDLKTPKIIKVLFALALSISIAPFIEKTFTSLLIFEEMFIGLVLGIIARTMLNMIHMFSDLVSFSVGLQNQTFIGNTNEINHINALVYFGMFNFLLQSGLDYAAIFYIKKSYEINILNNITSIFVIIFKNAFNFAVMLAVPIMIISFIMNIMCSILSKMIPQIPIFLLMQSIVLFGAGYLIGPFFGGKVVYALNYFNLG
jgi:flagellar biosynthetic protein FliR